MKNILVKNSLYVICITLGVAFFSISPSMAKKGNHPFVPCAHPMFRALDFWVGDWQVYHKGSGKLAGFDRVGRILKGCAIQQSWISLDDHFSSPMVPFRMNGKSLTAFNGQKWTQYWVDNQAGSQLTSGSFKDGKLTLKSEEAVMGHIYKLTWESQKDGTVHHMAQRQKTEEETWEILFDFIYRRNANGLPPQK